MSAFSGGCSVRDISRRHDSSLIAVESLEIFPEGFDSRIINRELFGRLNISSAEFEIVIIREDSERAVYGLVAGAPGRRSIGRIGDDAVKRISHYHSGNGH